MASQLSSRNGAELNPPQSQVAIFPRSEWKRINEKFQSWQNPSPSKAIEMQRQKEELHKQSKSVVKNWENTIEGQRIKRLQARHLREEKEERERERIDGEEAKFQAEQRKKAIERAKTLLYYQTDRVKKLNGALVLSEVLRERDAQVVHKKRREKFFQCREEILFNKDEKEREKATVADMIAADERAKQRTDLAQFHKKQHEEKAHKQLEERLHALEEQKELDTEATEDQLKRKRLDEERVQKQKEYRYELDIALEDKKAAAAREMQQWQIDEEKKNLYIKTKKHMEKLRKEKEKETKKQYQAHQQQMCDNLRKHMDIASSDEDHRIAMAVQKQIAKRDAEQQEKQLQYVAATREIHRHMLEQMAELQLKKKESEEFDQEMLKQRIIQDQKFHNQQLEKLKKANQEAKSLQQFHISQMSERQAQKQAEREDNISYDNSNQKLLEVEENQFQLLANTTINGARERKAPLQPLKVASKEGGGGGHGPMVPVTRVRPSYLAADSTAMELPSYTNKGLQSKANTQKRLGFIW